MPRDAAERSLFANRRNRGAADLFGTGRLGHRRQLALAAERRQRRHRGHGRGHVVLAGLLDQLAERMIAHAAFRLVADDVREHRRIADARHRDAADARVGVILRERVERFEIGGIQLVDRLDANVGIGVRGLGLGAELIENTHGCFRPRRRILRRPVPS